MTEKEKIIFTRDCVEKMANGINPFDGSQIPEDDFMNNVRVSRCLFYVVGLLDMLCGDNSNLLQPKVEEVKKKQKTYEINENAINDFPYVESGLVISQILNFLNVDLPENAKKLTTDMVTKHMLENGYLKDVEGHDGRTRRFPTRLGEELEMKTETRTGLNGNYYIVIYGLKAQKYIVENIRTIIQEKIEAEENSKIWTPQDDDSLIDFFNNGYTVAQISKNLKKPVLAIRKRLVSLGLISKNTDAV